MRVLVLSGSPRRHGNSDRLADALGRGAEEAGDEVERVFVRDLDVKGRAVRDGCGCNGGALRAAGRHAGAVREDRRR